MKFFELGLGAMMVRYYLMMAIIIGAIFLGQPLLAYLALPVFLSAILGVKFFGNDTKIVGHQFSSENSGLKEAA